MLHPVYALFSQGMPARRYRQSELDVLFQRADRQWEQGKLQSAFRLFLAAAKGGDTGCQNNLGYFYDEGIGVKPNRARALYWYRRAYRRGVRCAASNIGVVYRDEENWKQALAWFERAIKLEDDDANLEIAKIYLHQMKDRAKAIHYLKQTLKAKPDDVTEASREEAQRLLKQLSSNSSTVRMK
jgi:TPR repeat protein